MISSDNAKEDDLKPSMSEEMRFGLVFEEPV